LTDHLRPLRDETDATALLSRRLNEQ